MKTPEFITVGFRADKPLYELVRRLAHQADVSVSKYLTRLVKEKAREAGMRVPK